MTCCVFLTKQTNRWLVIVRHLAVQRDNNNLAPVSPIPRRHPVSVQPRVPAQIYRFPPAPDRLASVQLLTWDGFLLLLAVAVARPRVVATDLEPLQFVKFVTIKRLLTF